MFKKKASSLYSGQGRYNKIENFSIITTLKLAKHHRKKLAHPQLKMTKTKWVAKISILQVDSQSPARMESEKAEWETKGKPYQAVSEEQAEEQDFHSTLL